MSIVDAAIKYRDPDAGSVNRIKAGHFAARVFLGSADSRLDVAMRNDFAIGTDISNIVIGFQVTNARQRLFRSQKSNRLEPIFQLAAEPSKFILDVAVALVTAELDDHAADLLGLAMRLG